MPSAWTPCGWTPRRMGVVKEGEVDMMRWLKQRFVDGWVTNGLFQKQSEMHGGGASTRRERERGSGSGRPLSFGRLLDK